MFKTVPYQRHAGIRACWPCCAAAYDMQTEMSSSPAGGLR